MLLQIWTTEQVIRTIWLSVSQPMSSPSSRFRMPYWELKIHFHTMATAAGATTIGRKKMARKVVRPLILLFSSTATIRDRKMPPGTVSTQKKMVFQVAFQNSGLWNIST